MSLNLTKYKPSQKPGKINGHLKMVDYNRWLGPRHLTGTGKRLARLAWDKLRNR